MFRGISELSDSCDIGRQLVAFLFIGVKAMGLKDYSQCNFVLSTEDHDDYCFESYTPPSGQEDYVIILMLEIPRNERRKGKGRALLRAAINEIRLDYPSLPIRLAARPLDDDMSEDALVTFYESERFKVEDDSGNAVIMVRYD